MKPRLHRVEEGPGDDLDEDHNHAVADGFAAHPVEKIQPGGVSDKVEAGGDLGRLSGALRTRERGAVILSGDLPPTDT